MKHPITNIASFFLCGVFLIGFGVADAARQHRARLSSDLAEHLVHAEADSVDVIVPGTRDQIQALARRHRLRIKRVLRYGAVVEADDSALASFNGDTDVLALSTDATVRPMLGVTTEAVAADQVWRDFGAIGRGVGVAVIDSGIAPHPDIRDRIVAEADFTGEGTTQDL